MVVVAHTFVKTNCSILLYKGYQMEKEREQSFKIQHGESGSIATLSEFGTSILTCDLLLPVVEVTNNLIFEITWLVSLHC